MGEVVLVRHGQANSGATDEASYDKLSALGHQQAEWLGEWFRSRGETFDLAMSGSLRRQRETAKGILGDEAEIDQRFNELDYFNLAQALKDVHGVPLPTMKDFPTHLPQVMNAWHQAEIMGHETFASFEDRVVAALRDVGQEGRHVLCVTSGGVIGMIVRHLLQLDPTRMAHVLLPIRNTSIHRVRVLPDGLFLESYNATPHLDAPDRADARTTL